MSIETAAAIRVDGDDDGSTHGEGGSPSHRSYGAIHIDHHVAGPLRRYRLPLLVIAGLLVLGSLGWMWSRPPLIEDQLWTGEVRGGDLRIGVGGYGRLMSSGLVTLTSTTAGSVAAIHAFPGATLAKDDPVVTLRNADLLTELSTAEEGYSQKLGDQAALTAELFTKRAELRGGMEDAKDNLAVELLEQEAQTKLFESGIVSRLQLEKEHARVSAAQRRVSQAAASLDNLEKSHEIRAGVVRAAVAPADCRAGRGGGLHCG